MPGLQCCLRITGKLCFARATHPGCAEGQSSLMASSFRTPWNPPLTKGERKRLRGRGCGDKSLPVFGVFPIPSISPQEWGIQGVESECAVSAGGFLSALPTLHVDSRFRENDETGAVRLRRTGVWGVRRGAIHRALVPPPRMGVRGLKTLMPIREMPLVETVLHGTSLTVESRC